MFLCFFFFILSSMFNFTFFFFFLFVLGLVGCPTNILSVFIHEQTRHSTMVTRKERKNREYGKRENTNSSLVSRWTLQVETESFQSFAKNYFVRSGKRWGSFSSLRQDSQCRRQVNRLQQTLDGGGVGPYSYRRLETPVRGRFFLPCWSFLEGNVPPNGVVGDSGGLCRVISRVTVLEGRSVFVGMTCDRLLRPGPNVCHGDD